MASKSKKRRRVFRASCILAALIIAGSSFAWFTSKDEVTNRLSAQADFGVKIVESFAPPKNMLPGQEVNKDVYATNTGSIPAFVKEEVSTVMTVTIEKNTPALTDKSVEIKDDERYAVEAGSYLAYKPNGSQKVLGEIVVARPGDKTETEKLTFDPNNTVIPGTENGQYTDFVPDVAGLYVFRRVVNVDKDTKAEDFTTDGDYNATDVTKTGDAATVGYDAYYFVPGEGGDHTKDKYYKVSNLSVVPDNTPDKADDNVKTDGILLYASAGFVEEEKKVLDPMDLECVTYNDDTAAQADGAPSEGKYLVASYDTGDSNYETKFKVAADLYDKAIHQFEYATALQQSAEAEAEAAQGASASGATPGTGYQGAKDAYDAAAEALDNALNNAIDGTPAGLKASKKAYEEALVARDNAKEANDEAQRNYEQSMAKLYGTGHETDGSESVYTTGDGSLYGKYQTSLGQYNIANSAAHGSDTATFINELKAFNTAESKGLDFTGKTTQADLENMPLTVEFLEEFKTWLAGQPSDELHDFYAKYAQMLIDKKNYDEEFAKCFGTEGSSTAPASGSYAHTYLGNDGTGSANGTKKTLADKEADLTTAKNRYLGADETGTTAGAVYTFNEAVKAYNSAYNTMMEKLGVKEEKDKQYTDAEAIYTAADTEMRRAQGVYNAYLTAGALNDDTADNVLKMFIKLSDKVVCDNTVPDKNDQWQHHPHQLVNDVAEFYYTGLLEGGETSSKLVDSVTLSSNTTADMYKSFDFDINIAMKSVQVAYDENNNITATATPTELGAFANLKDKTDVETPVKWVDTVAASTAAWS